MQDAPHFMLRTVCSGWLLCAWPCVVLAGGDVAPVAHPHAPRISPAAVPDGVYEVSGLPAPSQTVSGAEEAETDQPVAAEGGRAPETGVESSEVLPASELLPLGEPRRPSPGGSDRKELAGGPAWVVQTVSALGAVLGLILVGRYALVAASRRGGSGGISAVEVLGRKSVGARQNVVLIRIGHRVLVVGDSSGGLRTLADLDDPEEVSAVLASTASGGSSSITRGFNDLVSRFTSEYPDPGQVVGELDEDADRTGRTRASVRGLLSRVRARNMGGGVGGY